jgi:CheY-like chemotaxis protein
MGRTRLPLIGISARSLGDEETLCLAAGMDAFLRKPVTGDMLVRVIAQAVVPPPVPCAVPPRRVAAEPSCAD